MLTVDLLFENFKKKCFESLGMKTQKITVDISANLYINQLDQNICFWSQNLKGTKIVTRCMFVTILCLQQVLWLDKRGSRASCYSILIVRLNIWQNSKIPKLGGTFRFDSNHSVQQQGILTSNMDPL